MWRSFFLLALVLPFLCSVCEECIDLEVSGGQVKQFVLVPSPNGFDELEEASFLTASRLLHSHPEWFVEECDKELEATVHNQRLISFVAEKIQRRVSLARFRREELGTILTRDINCMIVSHSCSTEWEISHKPGFGRCIQVGRGLLDTDAPNGLGILLDSRHTFAKVLFIGWGFFSFEEGAGKVDQRKHDQNLLRKLVEHVIDNRVGTISVIAEESFIGILERVVASVDQLGLCALSTISGPGTVGVVILPNKSDCVSSETRITKSYIVNLRQDKQRFTTMVNHARLHAERGNGVDVLLDLTRFDALDGRNALDLTPSILQLFRVSKSAFKNPFEDHGLRKGVLGCALSHLVIWAELALNGVMDDTDAVLVFEDDANLVDDFAERWEREWTNSNVRLDSRWDVLFLGFSGDRPEYLTLPVWHSVRGFPQSPRSHGGGTYAYIVRKRGARRLWELAKKVGIPQPIDWFIIEAFTSHGHITAYKFWPHLVIANTSVSSTQSAYPWGMEQFCASLSATRMSRYPTLGTLLRDVSVRVFSPKDLDWISPDAPVSIVVSQSTQHQHNLEEALSCHSVCVSTYPLIVGARVPDDVQCTYVFSHTSRLFLDPQHVLGRVNKETFGLDLYASLVSPDGEVEATKQQQPVHVQVLVDWIRAESLSSSHLILKVKHGAEVQNSSFLSRHSADMICVSGYQPCVHIGSLPRDLESVGKGEHVVHVFTLLGHTLLKQQLHGLLGPSLHLSLMLT